MNKKFPYIGGVLCCILSLFAIYTLPAFASLDNTSEKLIEYLAVDKVNLTLLNSNLKTFSEAITPDTFEEQKRYISMQEAFINAKIETLTGFLSNQKKKQQSLKLKLKNFKQTPALPKEPIAYQESINEVRALMKVNDKSIEFIETNLGLAYAYQKTLQERSFQLRLWKAAEKKNQLIQSKRALIQNLVQQRNSLYEKNIAIERQAKSVPKFTMERMNHEMVTLLNNQEILLIEHQIALLQLEIKLAEADYVFLTKNQDIKALESVLEVYADAANQLNHIDSALMHMLQVLQSETPALAENIEKQNKQILAKKINMLHEEIMQLKLLLQKITEEHQAILKKKRTSRQGFEDYQKLSLKDILSQISQIPYQFYQYGLKILTKMFDYYLWADVGPKFIFWTLFAIILTLFVGIRILLRQITQEKSRSRFSGHLYDGLLILLYRSLPQFLIAALIVLSFISSQVLFEQFKLMFHLLLIWIVYRQFKGIALLILLEKENQTTKTEKLLYRRFAWLFFLGAWATAFMIIGQELPLSFLLQDLFNRLFMLFLLAIVWVIWISRVAIYELCYTWYHSNKRPFQHLLLFLSILIPTLLTTTAVIGLLGYIHFAWVLAHYQAYILLILVVYVLLRELLNDVLDLLAEKMVSKLHNGWLWVEAVIKPLEKCFRFALSLLSILIILRMFKNDWEFSMFSNIKTIGNYELFSSHEIHITLFSVIEASVVLLVLFWLSKWTREFSYRWLYRKIVDAAIRNSVSVFTQYAVILLGAFVFLRVLGIDLSGLGMILGGLAVGMGFGLRDFASNIIGGLMLLIERPVREGDLITLGEYEGRVAHIGIRSMRVSSWDHMDVLIPNAETFNKPVTNWTHQDGVVRTVLPIKVNRADDPEMIQQMILEVLDGVPGVLKDPPFQVFLKRIDEALIEFEVRYFVNVQLSLRVAVRSDVLFAIMKRFKAAGIKAPVPPLHIEVEKKTQVTHDKKCSSKD